MHDELPLHDLERDNDHSMPLSHDLAPEPSSPRDVAEDVLISINSPIPFSDSSEFEVGDDIESTSEIYISIITKFKHQVIDESKDNSLCGVMFGGG